MKHCQECRQEKPYDEFAKNKVKRDGYQDKCRECKATYNKIYYEKTKHVHNPARYQRRIDEAAAVREYIKKYKTNRPCADCGIQYPYYVMDFDHQSDKLFTIGSAAGNKSLKAIKEEIEKCEVVCANCHRQRTFGP